MGEFADDTVMVGVFDADIGDLRKRMGNVASRSQYWQMGIMNCLPRQWRSPSSDSCLEPSDPFDIFTAMLKGYFPMTLSISKMSTIPVDILIGEDGKIVEAHYCQDTSDHLPVDRLIRFSKGE